MMLKRWALAAILVAGPANPVEAAPAAIQGGCSELWIDGLNRKSACPKVLTVTPRLPYKMGGGEMTTITVVEMTIASTTYRWAAYEKYASKREGLLKLDAFALVIVVDGDETQFRINGSCFFAVSPNLKRAVECRSADSFSAPHRFQFYEDGY